jgi:hypothetical protein
MGSEEPPPEREWPAHFPLDDCPDSDAMPTEGPLFRLVCGEPEDWKSQKELGKFLKHPECERASLSCFLDASNAADLRDALPKFENHKIAKALLEPKHGKLKRTGSRPGHVSLWLRDQFLKRAQELFRVTE